MNTVDPNHLKDFLLIFMAGTTIVIQLIGVVRNGKAQKREVTFSEQFVTRDFCNQAHHETARRVDRLEQETAIFRKELRDDIRSVHSRIDDLIAVVNQIKP